MATQRREISWTFGPLYTWRTTKGYGTTLETTNATSTSSKPSRRYENPYGCPTDEGKCFDRCNDSEFEGGYCGGSYRATCVCYRT
uniref:Defensin protein 2 n=1 Tax=Amblyomma hebraeum TaxID=34608 RepID=Q5VJF8_AMBHE|nr:defensin protein 2 [Amblyomma hebraeum]